MVQKKKKKKEKKRKEKKRKEKGTKISRIGDEESQKPFFLNMCKTEHCSAKFILAILQHFQSRHYNTEKLRGNKPTT